MQNLNKNTEILNRLVLIYCQGNHNTKEKLCCECQDLLDYAKVRHQQCSLDPKPDCKNCPVHCYKPEYREKIRQIMRFSGKRFCNK